MCGACGRTVTADEVLGPVRTLRQHLIVASTVNALCAGLPGVPGVKVAGDTWLLRGATGAATECRTVSELWAAIATALVSAGDREQSGGRQSRGPQPGGLAARLSAARPSAEGLRRDIIDAGLHQLAQRTNGG